LFFTIYVPCGLLPPREALPKETQQAPTNYQKDKTGTHKLP